MNLWICSAVYAGEEIDPTELENCHVLVKPFYNPHEKTLRLSTQIRALLLFDASNEAMDRIAVAARALGVESDAVSFTVQTEIEHLREIAHSKWDLVGNMEIAGILGVSRQRAHQLAAQNLLFPDPVARLRMGMLYDRGEVLRFKDRWKRIPGRPSKAVAPDDGCEQ